MTRLLVPEPWPCRNQAENPVLIPCAFLVVMLFTTVSFAAPATQVRTLTDLAPAIHAHIGQDRFREGFWGIRVESLESGRILFEHNADKMLKPASNAKLFTAALALHRLGPNHRIRTSFYASQQPTRTGTLKGDLWVYGRGDFSFAARFHNGDYDASLTPIIDALRQAGIRRIRGSLIGDASYFQGPPFGSGWTWDDLQHYYGAEVSALILEDNVVDLFLGPGSVADAPCTLEILPRNSYVTFVQDTFTTAGGSTRSIALHRPLGGNVVHVKGHLPLGGTNWTDAIAVHDAPLWFVTQCHQSLTRAQVRISQPPRTVDWLTPPGARPDYTRMVEIAAIDSPPLAELLRQMMKPSQNLYAHALFLQVGRQRQTRIATPTTPLESTGQAAIAELGDFLDEIGIPEKSVKLDEGSGLSRRALITPNAMVGLLKFMDQHRDAQVFRSSLPIAGVDGTLQNRMKGTPARDRVLAKTGTLAHVYTLSGYATTAAGERLVFSFMLNNNIPASAIEARSDLDLLAIMLATLNERS